MNNINYILEYLKYSKELTINPFGLGKASCNNRCKFCIISDRMQDKDISLEYFKQTTENTKKWLIKYLDILPEDITITFFFVAGELFYMGKEYFDLYKRVSKELYDIVSKKYSKIKFNIQSNILSSNKEVINNLIGLVQYINNLTPNTLFTTSFDLYSRFNEFTFNIWKENLIYMQNILQKKIMVEMILLQPSIEYYLNNDDDLTKTLDFILGNQDRFDMSFEEFILNDLINVELYPKTEDLVAFYRKIKNTFPNHPVLFQYKTREKGQINTIPRPECILIQFSDKPFSNDMVYTDEDLRIVNDNCFSGILSNLTKYPMKNILKFIPENNEGLYCLSNNIEANKYFDKKCGFCKYKPFCRPKCFIQDLVKYKPQECQIKALFELFDE